MHYLTVTTQTVPASGLHHQVVIVLEDGWTSLNVLVIHRVRGAVHDVHHRVTRGVLTDLVHAHRCRTSVIGDTMTVDIIVLQEDMDRVRSATANAKLDATTNRQNHGQKAQLKGDVD